jgi:glycosyltransferase involved in cell wall biosynthesis
VPTVATAVGGAPDVVEHGKSGWLVPPDDSAALQNAILMVLDDTALRTKLARDGRQQVRRNYALPVTGQRLRALYDRLVTGQPVSVPGHTLA